MRGVKSNLLLFVAAFLSLCCGSKSVKYEKYVQFLADPDNNLVQSKVVGNIKITMKYVPAEYRAYREIEGKVTSQKLYDSLVNFYKNSQSFLMVIGPDESEKSGEDIIIGNSRGYPDYVDKIMSLNFYLQDYISLKVGSTELKPVIVNFENTYGLTKSRTITIVFADKDKKTDLNKLQEYKVSWDDQIFSTGIQNFVFEQEDIKKIPKLEI